MRFLWLALAGGLFFPVEIPAQVRPWQPPPSAYRPPYQPKPAGPDWLALGVAHQTDRNWNEAVADFTRAIEQTPDLQSAHLLRGQCRWETQDYAGAEKDFTETIRLSGGYLALYPNRGYTRAMLGKHESALADFDWILARDPANRSALLERAACLVQLGRYAEAWRESTAALELHFDDVRAYDVRSAARCGLNDAAGALLDCDAAITLDPKAAEPYRHRARAKYQLGLEKAARKDYQRYVDLSNGSPAALFQQALFLEMTGDFTGALACCDQALTINPREYPALLHREILRLRLQQAKGAELTQAIPGLPNEWAAALGRYLANQLPEAELMRLAANSDPELVPAREGEARYFSGMMNLLQGNPAQGVELLRKCAASRRETADYWLARAELARLPPPAARSK